MVYFALFQFILHMMTHMKRVSLFAGKLQNDRDSTP